MSILEIFVYSWQGFCLLKNCADTKHTEFQLNRTWSIRFLSFSYFMDLNCCKNFKFIHHPLCRLPFRVQSIASRNHRREPKLSNWTPFIWSAQFTICYLEKDILTIIGFMKLNNCSKICQTWNHTLTKSSHCPVNSLFCGFFKEIW